MDILYITYPLSALVMIGAPVALAVYLTRRFRLGWRLWWIGAATFVLSQVGHIPFNTLATVLFQRGVLPSPPPSWSLPFNAVFLGLSAGLWEELMRYAMFRWWAKDARSWRKGVLAGAGHGGIEAIIFGGLALYGFLRLVALRGMDLTGLVPPDQLALAQQQINAYWSTPWPISLIGGVERIFTIIIQISLAVIVLQAFTRRQGWWVWVAVLWHAVVDAVAVFGGARLGIVPTEGLLAIMALISLGIAFALRQPEPEEPLEEAPPLPDSEELLRRIREAAPEAPEDFDRTRYN